MDEHRKVLVVVEDEPDMRMLIRLTLEVDPRLDILGETATAEEAIELARTTEPGLVVLDHQLDGEIMGLDAAPMLKEVAPMAKIILFSAFDLELRSREVPAVDAFLSKTKLPELLPLAQRLLGLPPL